MKTNQLQKNIPNGWQIKPLDDVCDILIGGTPARNNSKYWDENKKGGNIWISITDLSALKGKNIIDSSEYISEDGVKKSNVKLLPTGTVLMSFKLSIGKMAIAGKPLYTNEAIAGFIPKNENIFSGYLYYVLPQLSYEIDTAVKGKTLNKEKIKNARIIFPPKPEQEKIAEILGKVDEYIEKTEKIIGETEKLKKGLMDKLLAGKDKNKKWETVKIKKAPLEIVDGDRGINYPKQTDFSANDFCLFLNNRNIKNDFFDFSENQFISKENDIKLRKGKLSRYDCVLTTRGTIGTVAFYDNNIIYENIRINSGMLIFRAKTGLEPRFLYQLLKSEILKKKYKEMSSGSAQPQLPIKSLENIQISYPKSVEEQKEIAEILSNIDEKILVNKKLKEKFTQLKKGLMSDLLSGEVRVNNY